MHQKTAVAARISTIFSDWSDDRLWACRKGCHSCCTQNVTVTTLEVQQIIAFIRENNREEWLAAILAGELAPHRPSYTINTLARACLAGKELAEETPSALAPCPFLEENCCTIYPVRPFACRSFLSMKRCTPTQPALVDNAHLAAATAVNQLLEHLDQRQPWGNMLDLLKMLLAEETGVDGSTSRHTLRSRPLPGFMLGPEEYDRVAPLLERIFAATVNGRSVETILNGR
jgi:Fe-S-cluster containining protein